jgi:uncharacterized protein YbaR (Trm112 family)
VLEAAMDRKLLDILCCPMTKQPLALLNSAQLATLNAAIQAGGVKRNDDSPQTQAISKGIITRDHTLIYRIDSDIPVLLGDEAISTTQISDFPG